MMKYRAVRLFVAAAALIGLATAQNSHVGSTSAKSDADLHAATKPLTPKSAMPAKRTSSSAVPRASQSSGNATAELTHLERTEIKAGGSNNGGAVKGVSAPKPAAAASGSGINFKYQPPKGGETASRGDAHSANSQKPRVQSH
jgi:hypothetical protein